MNIQKLNEYPIEEYLSEDYKTNTFLYLDKSSEEEKNYHMYFYYDDGSYDICTYVDGIDELSKEEYLEKMKESLIEIVRFTYFEDLLDKYEEENDTEFYIYDIVKRIISGNKATDEEKAFLKEFYIEFLNEELEEKTEEFKPYQKKFTTNITEEELDKYNHIKDEIGDIKSKISSIEEFFKFKDFSKDIERITRKQEELLKTLKGEK